MPELSALIAVRNPGAALASLLEAVKRQTLATDRFEIVVVDDGSTDDTKAVVERAATSLPLRYFRQRASGLAAAKNLAVLAARSPLLLPLRVDEIPRADNFVAHLAAHIRHPSRTGTVPPAAKCSHRTSHRRRCRVTWQPPITSSSRSRRSNRGRSSIIPACCWRNVR